MKNICPLLLTGMAATASNSGGKSPADSRAVKSKGIFSCPANPASISFLIDGSCRLEYYPTDGISAGQMEILHGIWAITKEISGSTGFATATRDKNVPPNYGRHPHPCAWRLLVLPPLPNFSFEPYIGFLFTKQLVYKVHHWRWRFYVHVFTSTAVLVAGLFQFSRYLLRRHPGIQRAAGTCMRQR